MCEAHAWSIRMGERRRQERNWPYTAINLCQSRKESLDRDEKSKERFKERGWREAHARSFIVLPEIRKNLWPLAREGSGDWGFTGIDARARGSFVPRIFSTRSKKVEDRERERENKKRRKGSSFATHCSIAICTRELFPPTSDFSTLIFPYTYTCSR